MFVAQIIYFSSLTFFLPKTINDTLIIKSPHLILQEGGKSISVSDIIERLERLENADRESGE